MVFNKVQSSNSQLLASSSLSIPHELSMPTPKKNDPLFKPKRDLAWCIAPTLLISFKYAWAGLRYAFITQRNFRIHTIIGTLAISLGVFLHITMVELAVIALTSGLVMTLELLNTAIESVVDLTVKQSYHELAKIAKDCAAGAVLVSAIAALFVAGALLVPPLLARLQSIVQ
ncbi:MAG TPA: diacylglycerol kinase [Cyanobacteria bacterium UBA12227]|nr:diacylglycerol kinase [Cyanobacteria bacterium UBA12227]HAX87636.1 diacylglycerol kinase [Cyanobacteria bacterium UBA11370]